MATSDDKELMEALQQTIKQYAERSFPKVCNSCGRRYETLQDFLDQTTAADPNTDGIFVDIDYRDDTFIDFIRNCPCGTSMFVAAPERRDTSDRGKAVRDAFGKLLEILEAKGMEREAAREELLKVAHGHKSSILDNLPSEARDEIRKLCKDCE